MRQRAIEVSDDVRQPLEMDSDQAVALELADQGGRARGEAAAIGEEGEQQADGEVLRQDLMGAEIDD